MITLNTAMYQDPRTRQNVAEEILDDLRNCPPAPGYERVEIPGERERAQRRKNTGHGIALPAKTWRQITRLSSRLEAMDRAT